MLVIQCEYELESLKYFNYYSSGWYCSFPQLSLLWLNLRCFINPIITLLHNQNFLKSSIYYKKAKKWVTGALLQLIFTAFWFVLKRVMHSYCLSRCPKRKFQHISEMSISAFDLLPPSVPGFYRCTMNKTITWPK